MNERKRIRQWGIEIGRMSPGRYNAITDVAGVGVGHCTLVRGGGKLIPGKGPVRTGVTAVKPHQGNIFEEKVTAYCHIINGYGKSVGIPQIQELGVIETPILLTSTLNVGRAADALIDYMIKETPGIGINTSTINPVVGECNDSYLNDIQGRHVGKEEVFKALNSLSYDRVEEGAVGAGTGMVCMEYKGGIGTSSRIIEMDQEEYTVGILVLSNFGSRENLMVAGLPAGRLLDRESDGTSNGPGGSNDEEAGKIDDGSIMIVLATDLPLSSRQLGRLAKRVPMGLGRVGSIASHGSGDFVLAFSTAYKHKHDTGDRWYQERRLLNENHKAINDIFLAVVESTEEAILNSLFMAETVVGRDNHKIEALPVEKLVQLLLNRHFL